MSEHGNMAAWPLPAIRQRRHDDFMNNHETTTPTTNDNLTTLDVRELSAGAQRLVMERMRECPHMSPSDVLAEMAESTAECEGYKTPEPVGE